MEPKDLVPQAIAKAKEIDGAPKHAQEDRSSKAWEALRQAFMAIKKDATLLQGHKPADMQLLLELAVERGTKRKMLKNQAKETLDMLLGSPAWLATAQATPALLDRLCEFAQAFPALQERLAAPVEEGKASADAAHPMTITLASEDANDFISEGWRKMTEFKFQFPKASVTGTDVDDAAEAFSIFFQGLQKMPAGARSDLLDKLSEQDYEHFMEFAEGLCEKKPSWRQRVNVVIRKWGGIVPAFKDVADRRPIGATASAEAPRSRRGSEATPEATAAPKIPVVFWVDHKPAAYESSTLAKNKAGIRLQGFHDASDPGDRSLEKVWISEVISAMENAELRVVVLIVNRKHEEAVKEIEDWCLSTGQTMPKVIVATRATELDWGAKKLQAKPLLANDWNKATTLAEAALEEASA